MHKYLKEKLPWYRHWHEQWINNHAHWLVFTCAVLTATWLFSYIVQSAPGQAIVEDIVPAVYAQSASDQSVVLASPEIVPTIPVVPDRVVK